MRSNAGGNETRMKSKYVFYLKAFAIFSVICAHAAPVPESFGTLNQLAHDILNYIGTMGVPMFFVISGFFFARNKHSFGTFWKRKAGSIILPWIFCYTLLWLYVVLRKGGISFKNWIAYVGGFGSTAYYLSMLIVLFLLLWFVKNKIVLVILIAFSCFSVISTGWLIGICPLNGFFGSFYTNPFNWLCFFALGMLISLSDCADKIKAFSKKTVWLWSVLSVVYFVVLEYFDPDIYYFSRYSLIGHAINLLLFCAIAAKAENAPFAKVLSFAGEYSFSIYFSHQFIVGAIVKLTNLKDVFVITLIRPFMVFAVMLVIMQVILKVCKGKLGFARMLIGIRD